MADWSGRGGLEWSDLEVILAIGRAESLAGAGRLLRCSHTTVYRRINAIEERAGVRFFERLPTGYAMTDAGEVAMRVAERVEAEVLALSREILGRDAKVQGKVVLTAPEGIISEVLPPILADFHRQYPEVAVDMLEGQAAFDLARREADIAIRATRTPPDDSLGRRIGAFRFAAYGHPDYLAAHRGRPLAEHDLCVLQGTLAWMVPHVWKTRAKAEERVVLRSNAAAAVIRAVRASMGVTIMPCYRADPIADLQRLGDPLEHLTLELWILTHPALRHSARVKVLLAHLTERLSTHASLFDGTSVVV